MSKWPCSLFSFQFHILILGFFSVSGFLVGPIINMIKTMKIIMNEDDDVGHVVEVDDGVGDKLFTPLLPTPHHNKGSSY